MLNEEQVAAELDNALGALEELAEKCSAEVIKGTTLQESLKRISDHLLETLPSNSPAYAYVKQAALWPLTVWSDPSTGYAIRGGVRPVEVWIKQIRRALDSVQPGFMGERVGAKDRHYFSPGEKYEAQRTFLVILRRALSSVSIVDPYLDETALDFARALPDTVAIRLLTTHPQGPFARLYNSLRASRPGLEARLGTGFHGRLIEIDGREVWIVDASLKDIADKGTSIHRVPDAELQKSLDDIASWWTSGKPLYP